MGVLIVALVLNKLMCIKDESFSPYNSFLLGGEPGEDTEEFLELQEKLKNPEKMTRLENFQ